MEAAVTNNGRYWASVCIPNKNNDCKSTNNLYNPREKLERIIYIYSYKIFDETARRLKSILASTILIGQRISSNWALLFFFGKDKFNARLWTLILISIFGD